MVSVYAIARLATSPRSWSTILFGNSLFLLARRCVLTCVSPFSCHSWCSKAIVHPLWCTFPSLINSSVDDTGLLVNGFPTYLGTFISLFSSRMACRFVVKSLTISSLTIVIQVWYGNFSIYSLYFCLSEVVIAGANPKGSYSTLLIPSKSLFLILDFSNQVFIWVSCVILSSGFVSPLDFSPY